MVEMVCRLRPILLLLVSLAVFYGADGGGFAVSAQTPNEADAFFSGTVVEHGSDRVTVSRTIQGKSPERRTFLITSSTTVEGNLKENSRVTVRFVTSENGDVALSIIVREKSNQKR